MADICKGPVKFDGHVIGEITGCTRDGDYLYLDMTLDDGLHPVYSSDGEVWLRDEPDNAVAYEVAQIVKGGMAGLSIDTAGGAEVVLTPATPRE